VADPISIRRVNRFGEHEISGLCDVLVDCVEGGASVSFMLPMTRAKAENFWRGVAASAERGERVVLVAEDETGAIIGTVQLITNLPENQPHRADVAKMLVRRSARRRGVGSALLRAAEQQAIALGRTLLVLDTVTGGDAERMYARENWQVCGQIPCYALWPNGEPCSTTVFYKMLSR